VGLTLPTLSYFVGYSINFFKPSNRPLDFVYSVVALIGGGVTYVYLSIINNPLAAATTEIEISNRSVPSFWAAHTTINGPAMDLYSMLGMSLISLVIFGKPNNIKLKNYLFITIASLTFSLMALYSSLALQGRKTFVSLALVIVIAIFFNLKKQTISNDKFLTIVKLFILFILFIIGLNTFNMLFEYLNETYGIFRRFNSEGLDTPRYLVWMEVLQGMPENLLGGRMFKISANFAHNLWLDVLYDCGLFPLLLLLIFHFLQVKAIGKICLSKFHKNDIINICLIATLVSFLFGWQAEPVIQASVYYFSMTCCFFGLVMRFAQTIDNHNHGRQTT
jgi:O-antigen ligase